MDAKAFVDQITLQVKTVWQDLSHVDTYVQFMVILGIYATSYFFASQLRRVAPIIEKKPQVSSHPFHFLCYRIDRFLFPVFAILMLAFSNEAGKVILEHNWVLTTALTVAIIIFVNSFIDKVVFQNTLQIFFKLVAFPLVFMHMVGWLEPISGVLKTISLEVGNIHLSLYGLCRVLVFGTLLFWLGRASNNAGKGIIRKQQSLDIRTREVFAKLFEVVLFCVIALLLLNIMGINLTTLAVFGGAVGVGLGFGLQSIASNFISGIIILIDRSLTVGDYIEMEDGKTGFVREFNLRYTTLETYDGKDIMVPNEKFISSSFVNWSRKDPKQRYRVDFSVAYESDVRNVCDLVKAAVAQHEQVLSGDPYPIEIQPDCEIDSFADSGVNLFVEFWMEGIDDGRNRVGGDLMLVIFEVLRENNISIPFPQREVRILNQRESAL